MKKKSIMALGLVAMLTVGMSVPAMAADTTLSENANSGNVTISYTQSPKYTVTIPGDTTWNPNDGNTLSVSIKTGSGELFLESGHVVKVSTSSTIDLKNGNSESDKITIPVTAPTNNGDELSGTVSNCQFKLGTPTEKKWNAATYTGTLIFSFTTPLATAAS